MSELTKQQNNKKMHLEAHSGARMSATTKLLPLSQENYDIKTPVTFFLFYNCTAHSKKKEREREGEGLQLRPMR